MFGKNNKQAWLSLFTAEGTCIFLIVAKLISIEWANLQVRLRPERETDCCLLAGAKAVGWLQGMGRALRRFYVQLILIFYTIKLRNNL